MECPRTNRLSDVEYLTQLNQKILQQRIPVSGTLGLTYRCNLQCVHCFLGDRRRPRDTASRELNTSQWRSILDQITEAGCLNLTFTGGEPLLRRDFKDLYLHAKKNGLLVTIFSNGTLFSPSTIEFLAEWPPRLVDISLYGASTSSYERISGSKDAYQRCLEGIQSLLDHGIAASVKTVLMSYNAHELDEMKQIAEKAAVHFRFDPAVLPHFTGEMSPLSLRVSPEEVAEKEFSDPKQVDLWKRVFEKQKEISVRKNTLYQCGSGLNSFYIDPFGCLQGCLMASSP
ncbi:MAG: radical SAM protein, partial [bacterium]|nr:radical SAM protein [bacterium]